MGLGLGLEVGPYQRHGQRAVALVDHDRDRRPRAAAAAAAATAAAAAAAAATGLLQQRRVHPQVRPVGDEGGVQRWVGLGAHTEQEQDHLGEG